jgi:hypothetical protein
MEQRRWPMKVELLSMHEGAFRVFTEAIRGLDERAFERKWLDGKWGIREIVAHITGWHGQFASGLERLARGEPLNRPGAEWAGLQDLNDTFAEHAKGKLRDEILFELERAVHHFREAAYKLPEEAFEDGRVANELVHRAGIRHFNEHLAMIEAHFAAEKETAGLSSK